MATTNQRNRSAGQKGSSAGQSGQGKIKQAASQAGQKVTDIRHEVAGYVSQGNEQFGRMTEGHEGQAVLVALAAGFGIGFVIGCALVSGHRQPQTWRERVMAEGIGRKFMDRMEQMLPNAITEHFAR
jgi:hypothetical protein